MKLSEIQHLIKKIVKEEAEEIAEAMTGGVPGPNIGTASGVNPGTGKKQQGFDFSTKPLRKKGEKGIVEEDIHGMMGNPEKKAAKEDIQAALERQRKTGDGTRADVMRKRQAMKVREADGSDDAAADELYLYMTNDGALYDAKKPFEQQLARKMDKGTYDSNLATKLWAYYVVMGAKKYEKEMMSPSEGRHIFTPSVRMKVAAMFRDAYEEQEKWNQKTDDTQEEQALQAEGVEPIKLANGDESKVFVKSGVLPNKPKNKMPAKGVNSKELAKKVGTSLPPGTVEKGIAVEGLSGSTATMGEQPIEERMSLTPDQIAKARIVAARIRAAKKRKEKQAKEAPKTECKTEE